MLSKYLKGGGVDCFRIFEAAFVEVSTSRRPPSILDSAGHFLPASLAIDGADERLVREAEGDISDSAGAAFCFAACGVGELGG